jgi:hypothetical protein
MARTLIVKSPGFGGVHVADQNCQVFSRSGSLTAAGSHVVPRADASVYFVGFKLTAGQLTMNLDA